jgi:hypothetical protein
LEVGLQCPMVKRFQKTGELEKIFVVLTKIPFFHRNTLEKMTTAGKLGQILKKIFSKTGSRSEALKAIVPNSRTRISIVMLKPEMRSCSMLETRNLRDLRDQKR